MTDTLLTTKLQIPQTALELVPRPHLVERLDKGLARKLTLVSAPAGFGKSTLVAGWLAESDPPAAWLSLDAGLDALAHMPHNGELTDEQVSRLAEGGIYVMSTLKILDEMAEALISGSKLDDDPGASGQFAGGVEWICVVA